MGEQRGHHRKQPRESDPAAVRLSARDAALPFMRVARRVEATEDYYVRAVDFEEHGVWETA